MLHPIQQKSVLDDLIIMPTTYVLVVLSFPSESLMQMCCHPETTVDKMSHLQTGFTLLRGSFECEVQQNPRLAFQIHSIG